MPFKNEKERRDFHDKVMKLRKKMGWGRLRIARELSLSPNTVGNWIYSKKGRSYHRDWERKHRLTTSGHRKVLGKKRPYPVDSVCELCHSSITPKGESLDYHHWDDNNLMKGLWLCRSCHINAEWIDKGSNQQCQWIRRAEGEQYIERYVKLKAQINKKANP